MIWETEKGDLIAEQTLHLERERGCEAKEQCSAFEVHNMEGVITERRDARSGKRRFSRHWAGEKPFNVHGSSGS